MAITIAQSPETVAPVYNPLIHVVTSNKYAESNFRYICDIYVNGGSTYVERQSVPPDPTYGSGVFDVSRILEAYITKDFDSGNVASFNCGNSTVSYILKFGEEYGASSSGTTVYPNLTVQSKKYAWNGIFDFKDYCNTTFADYVSGDATKDFLTNSPNQKTVYVDSNYANGGKEFIYGINESSGSIFYMLVHTEDSGGNTLGNYRVKNNYQALSSDNQKMWDSPVALT